MMSDVIDTLAIIAAYGLNMLAIFALAFGIAGVLVLPIVNKWKNNL